MPVWKRSEVQEVLLEMTQLCVIETGDLIRLLPNWEMLPQQAHLVYPSRKYQPQRTRALLQFMAERIPKLPGFHAPAS